MRILAFSDVHGNIQAVKKLINEASEKAYYIIVFGGDFTTALFDGADVGQKQMDKIAIILESTKKPLYFVPGNRDNFIDFNFGMNIEDQDWEVGDYTLTNNSENLDDSKILVTHMLERKLQRKRAGALLYLFGHDHIGRIYKNYIDLGFLYRGTEAHGAARSVFGCYWLMDVDDDNIQIINRSWELREFICPIHSNQGTFYIPHYWRRNCPLCYDELEHTWFF
jgi:predicted phosphodiesterase